MSRCGEQLNATFRVAGEDLRAFLWPSEYVVEELILDGFYFFSTNFDKKELIFAGYRPSLNIGELFERPRLLAKGGHHVKIKLGRSVVKGKTLACVRFAFVFTRLH